MLHYYDSDSPNKPQSEPALLRTMAEKEWNFKLTGSSQAMQTVDMPMARTALPDDFITSSSSIVERGNLSIGLVMAALIRDQTLSVMKKITGHPSSLPLYYDPGLIFRFTENKSEFLKYDNLSGGTLPNWVGVYIRDVRGQWNIIYDLEYVHAVMSSRPYSGDKFSPAYFREELGHEIMDKWVYDEMSHGDSKFHYSIPWWLREGISEWFFRERKGTDNFLSLVTGKEAMIPTLLEITKTGWNIDRARTDRNVAYQTAHNFVDFMEKRITAASGQNRRSSMADILSLIHNLQREGRSGEDFTIELAKKTGMNLELLEKEWRTSLDLTRVSQS